ncbi:MAG: beta-ketoacyl synthase chain length factor, partial [Burkholderiales bacterium]|nr:beta-ketoacyl synthase chain length factor [Burkholderiales bacterium]
VCVAGVGLLGPGLAGWGAGRALLRDAAAWVDAATVVPVPQRLPATERRRAGALVKASVAVADEALATAGLDPAPLATVFTSSTGDPLNCHLLCEALAAPERLVSPTRFTNSVHNAAAGYWHIATASRAPSTSLAAHDASFGAGLLEAAVQCAATRAPVLLVACDLPYPEPLHALRPVADLFAAALLLAPAGPGRRLRLRLDSQAASADGTPCADALESLRRTIPAARALPLLQALARDAAATVRLEVAPGLALQLGVDAA